MTASRAPERPQTGLSLERMRRIVAAHRGDTQAIESRDIAALLDVPDGPSIRETVGEPIERGLGIGSTTRDPVRYYLIPTERELRESVAQLRSRTRQLERRAAGFEDVSRRGARQAALFAEAEA